MAFGDEIKKAREKLDLSQEEAARQIEKKYKGVRLSPSYLSMIENGSKTNLTTNLIDALLDFYKLPPHVAYTLFPSVSEELCSYDVTTIAAHRADNPLADLSPEARKSVEDYIEYVRNKYPKKDTTN